MSLEQHPPFLICVPIEVGADTPAVAVGRIEALLDTLGNPAAPALREALDDSRVIHFMSMAVVWDQDSHDPPVLVAHVAGDGEPKTIIAAVAKHVGLLLLPVFRAAADVETLKALETLLQRYWVNPAAVSFAFGRSVTGLPFQGTPGLTVARIREDAQIAQRARDAVFAHARSRPCTANSCLGAARTAVGITNPNGRPFSGPETTPRLAQASLLTKAFTFLKLIVFDLSFFVIILLVLFAMIIQNLLITPDAGHSQDFLYAVPLAIVFGILLNFIVEPISKSIRRRPSRKTTYKLALTTLLILASTGAALIVSWWLPTPALLEKWHFQPFAWWVAGVLGLLSLVLLLALAAAGFLGLLWFYETRAKPDDADPGTEFLAELMRREDRPTHRQNHIFSAATIQPHFFRRFISLPVGLYVASLTVRLGVFKTGFLAGIATIHFIQWARIPGTRKLVFAGDYDGSWQSYLEDAVTLLPGGATGIWSNAVGFPKTRLLFFEGATDGDRFKRWVRRQMIPTRFWYSAYPGLTATEIRRNAHVRCGLEAKMTPSQVEAWLSLLGSDPRPVSSIETDQIQGVALSGYRRLREGALLAVSFPQNPAACRAWLADVSARVDFGDAKEHPHAMAVALSARGLKALGLEATHPLAAQFSPPFAMGMESETRSKALGDVDATAPCTWEWGGPEIPVDAVLLLYAKDPSTMRRRLEDELARCDRAGLKLQRKIKLQRFPRSHDRFKRPIPIREPFGFVDGISQPSIRGLRSSQDPTGDVLEPGEFILGYPDGRKRFPPTPQVFADADPKGLLPDLPPEFPGQPSKAPVRDLGRNGSYLVVRQLKQDVGRYRRYVNAAARHLGETPEKVAAKLVGRWRNGAPLVLHPHSPPDRYDPTKKEEFLFGRDDPQGFACPLGAHIRRANPRDQFKPGDETQISITNRHRILRRGRSYVEGGNTGAAPQGLLFMCLNADIERQFEFVQQTWIDSTAFGSLCNEADPIMAANRANGTYTIPTLGRPRQLIDLPSFVSMIGGGYFFLPGRQALMFLSSYGATPPQCTSNSPTTSAPTARL